VTSSKIVERNTAETRIRVEVGQGAGIARISTSVPFLDHMLAALAKYSALDLNVTAAGDLRHHIIEDVGLTLGQAIAAAVPVNAARYGERTVPMDDALVQAVFDIGGRPYYQGPLPSSLYDHWMRSFCDAGKFTLHLRVLRGEDRHHIVEAAFKAVGFALRQALGDAGSVMSTKGVVSVERE
jgi:imidazoleglycerol-phosphate dehydratase